MRATEPCACSVPSRMSLGTALRGQPRMPGFAALTHAPLFYVPVFCACTCVWLDDVSGRALPGTTAAV